MSQEEETGSMYSPEPEDDQAPENDRALEDDQALEETVQPVVEEDDVGREEVLQEAAVRLHADVANLRRAARGEDDNVAEREMMTELLSQAFQVAVGQTMDKALELKDVVANSQKTVQNSMRRLKEDMVKTIVKVESESRRATAVMRDEHDRSQQRCLQAMESMKTGIRQEMKESMERSQEREHDMAEELKHQMREEKLLEATRSLTTQAGKNEERITGQLRETMRLVQEGQEGVRDGLEKVTQRHDTSQSEMRRKIDDVESSLRRIGGEVRNAVDLRSRSNSRERLREESLNAVTTESSMRQSRTSRPSVRMSNAPPMAH